MSNHAGFLRKKKVLLSFLLPYGLFLIVANVIYRKVFLSRKGRGWRLSVVFVVVVVVVNLTLPLRLTKSLLFRSQGSLSHYDVVGSLIQHQSLTNAIGEVVYDLDKGIEKLEVLPTILGHYNDFSHVWRSYDRSIGWSNSSRDNSTPRPVPSSSNSYGVVSS